MDRAVSRKIDAHKRGKIQVRESIEEKKANGQGIQKGRRRHRSLCRPRNIEDTEAEGKAPHSRHELRPRQNRGRSRQINKGSHKGMGEHIGQGRHRGSSRCDEASV